MELDERTKIREHISNLSFEALLKLKEQVGTKTFSKTVYGGSCAKKSNFKRANKNRPREVSSKIRPQKLKLENNIQIEKKPIPRDPRFDPLCGEFEHKIFKENYSFIKDIRLNEKRQLEEELKTCVNPKRKEIIRKLLQRMNNQLLEQERQDKEKCKKIQKRSEIKEKLRNGEKQKPLFKKKSVEKLENAIEKYEELKKSNKLQKHIEKKSKKLSSKERRIMEKSNS